MKYYKPKTIEEALELKNSEEKSFFLAGGTEINTLYRKNEDLETLIDLKFAVPSKITVDSIGAMATLQDIIDSPRSPAGIKEAATEVNNRNIRNLATIGGNIASNKSASDIIGTLIACKAKLLVITNKEKKKISVSKWIKSPEGLILEIKFPDPERQVFHRRFSRTKNDLPLVKISAGFIKKDEGALKEVPLGYVFEDVIIAAGSVAEKVTILENTSNYLTGKSIADIEQKQIRDAVDKDINPIDDHRASAAYRKELVYAAIEELVNYKG